jgi:HD-GYP domain-containing protein (c-di-GMP phosphodiesterase class II)
MVLGRAVYDIRGQLVLDQGDRLTEENLGLVARSGTAEVLVEDPRVEDVMVGSLYPAYLEAKAVQALHVLLVLNQGVTEGMTAEHLIGVRPVVHQMTERLFPAVLGDPDLTGLSSLQGYDYIHPAKVAGLAMLIGRTAGFGKEDIYKLGIAAMLQNLGYLSLPPGILEKAGPLTEDEWRHVRRHPRHTTALLQNSGLDADVMSAIEHHHERWNGSGYPEGRKRDEISPLAQIIALADTYHAFLSRRPHREALRPHEAVEFVVAYSGELFDPELTQFFARKIPQYPAGLGVRLSTGETGIISNPNLGHIARPIVRICFDRGRPVEKPYDLDLSDRTSMNKLIVEVLL